MKIRFYLLLMTLLVLAGAKAQNVNTPYSMYGYGIIGDRATSMQRQMGSVGYAMNGGRQINVMNPASYASVDSMTFLFDMGADVSMLWSKDNTGKSRATGGGLDYVTMQFPLTKYMGASIGLLPYSSVGYAFGNDVSHGTLENNGSGGINQAYLGVSGKIGNFSLGVNVSYDFGTIVNDRYVTPLTGGQVKFEHVMEIRDFNVNIGAQYNIKWNNRNKLVLGLTYSPRKTIHGKTWATQQETNQDARPDTVAYSRMDGRYDLAATWGAGISYSYFRTSRIMVEADITYQEWSKAKYPNLYALDNPDIVVFRGMNFSDRIKYALGAEYQPRVRGRYYQRMTYRIGGYYVQDYLNLYSSADANRHNPNHMREYGVTAGFGFPTPEGRTMINLGFEWKHRQTYPHNLLGENYFNITLGVNFNEVWFWKRKIK